MSTTTAPTESRLHRAERLNDQALADMETVQFLARAAELPNTDHVRDALRQIGRIAGDIIARAEA